VPPAEPVAAAHRAPAEVDSRTTKVHADGLGHQAPEAWQARHRAGVALQQQDRADDAAATLSGLLRDSLCPPAVQRDVLQRLADLCVNRFGDAAAARVLLKRLAPEDGHDLQADLASIVVDQYTGDADAQVLSTRLKALAQRYLAGPSGRTPSKHPQAHQRRRQPTRRPRIALISNQWCASPVAFLTLGALRELARHAELAFFDRGGKADWARKAFQALASGWHDVWGTDSEQIHKSLLAADADALIDLSGWTDPAALQAVARRPVVRQLKWVGGQAATTGANCFDGFVADARQVPAGCESLYTEPVLRAATGYVTYTPPPYWQPGDAIALPPAAGKATPGIYAIAANPVKISRHTAEFVRSLKPGRLLLIDHRWRHQQTRRAAAARLGSLLDVAEFVTPATHPEYLDTLAATPATFVDTAPYAMGLAAVELRLLGKPIVQPPRPLLRSISECHCAGHVAATSFNHHAQLAEELLGWCRARR
jgi:hypothetical protein